MSNENRRWRHIPWGMIILVIAVIIAAIVGATLTLWLNPPPHDFSISVSPMQGAAQPGAVIQTTITVKGIHGYKYPVSLSASGQPFDIVIAFIPPFGEATPTYASTMAINVGSNVPAGDYTIIIKGTGADEKKHTCSYTLAVKSMPVTPTPVLTSSPMPSPAHTPKKVVNVPDAFYPGGWMGDWGDITLDDVSTDNPYSEPACIKITYSAARSQGEGWSGIYWQYPDKNWGNKIEGRDLTGSTQLTFWARGEKGGEKAEFKVGGITGEYHDSIQPPVSIGLIVLSDNWQQYTIDLAGNDLSHVIGGFCWVTNKNQNPHGCTIYLDDIRYE